MVWLVRAIVVGLFIVYGPILLAPNHQPMGMNLFSGLLTGLAVIGLSLLIGKIGKKIHTKAPVGANRIGIGLYWLGIAIAVFCLGVSGYAAFYGGSARIVGMLASFAIVYWAAGWGLRRALTAN